jgi:hypothetical protein
MMRGKELFGSVLSVAVSGGMVFGAYTLYAWALPQPVVVLQHRITDKTPTQGAVTTVDVSIEKGTWGNLVNLSHKHNNVECLWANGFSVSSFSTSGAVGESILQLRREGTYCYDEFLDLCSECKVSTEVACDAYPAKVVKWDGDAQLEQLS